MKLFLVLILVVGCTIEPSQAGCRLPNPDVQDKTPKAGCRLPNPDVKDGKRASGCRLPNTDVKDEKRASGCRLPNPDVKDGKRASGCRLPNTDVKDEKRASGCRLPNPDVKVKNQDQGHISRRNAAENLDFGADPTGAVYIQNLLKLVYDLKEWRDLMVSLATPQDLANKEFTTKWHVADEEIKNRGQKLTITDSQQMRTFLRSEKWKGLVILNSDKAELVNQEFRDKWGLGPAGLGVINSDENGNYFLGPQWTDFMIVSGNSRDFPNSQSRAKWFRKWLLAALDKMIELSAPIET